MKCKNCGKKHLFKKDCLDDEFACWLVDNAENWDANWCLLKRHLLNEMREAGFDIIKKEHVRGEQK